ncbi:MAG: pyridoxal phosphate-dependent aminotransferase [Desulfobacterales bacterium]|jgi:(5-formylfuran-3-yl)methyl phosphate transaminase|nr:pyridoxal phosphate-dependent aminotransferase [Desulfobacteraceae bacterium]MBT4365063.1 pyridoxal phosphate-dependent aminotransferase [Desulfobacteraceae bacterium]MBT7085887.1 pyridoxal phosphate-dependent aminotransferase [Desulfobacterales bacterium]MBT7697831.1 pyridoxal phosphate-dependent aminotransferase [Desulfobacterales bacterium]
MISKRTEEISPFIVMEVLEKAHSMEREGIDIVHLEVGEPDFDAPECVKTAAIHALEEGHTNYTHSLGDLDLRQAVSGHYKRVYNVSVDPERIIITSGTSPAIFLALSVFIEKGDHVIISDPHYACYPNFIRFLDGKPVTIPVYEEDGFQYRPEEIQKRITKETKAVFINSPSNPTGNLLSKDRMKEIAALAEAESINIISDEIYHGLVYEGKEHSILEFNDNSFVVNGFSKLYAMTGLRLGYLIAPEKYIRPIQKIQQNFFISANSIMQIAGIAALEKADEDILRMKKIYNERRKYMIKRLKDLGFGIKVEPTGAFYVFANAKHLSGDSYKLAFDILKKAHVGVTPGIDFGENGEGYLRFSYANSIENITEGMKRLENYLNKR